MDLKEINWLGGISMALKCTPNNANMEENRMRRINDMAAVYFLLRLAILPDMKRLVRASDNP